MIKDPDKKKIYTIFLVLLTIINVTVAIVIFTDIQIIESPKIDVEVRVIEITADELILEIKMKLHNPNSFEISMEDFKVLSTTKNGDKIGEMSIKGGSVHSDKTEVFTEIAKIKFKEKSDFKILKNKITGKIGVEFLGFIKKTIPLELNVLISLEEIIGNIEIPDIDLEFYFDNLTRDGLEFTAGINIYNPNDIGITINELTLDAINDQDENVGKFKITGGEIRPKNHSFFKSTGVLLYKFIDTRELILSVGGKGSVNIAGMNKTISISTDMSIILPDIQDFIFQNENIKFYIPVQFKLTFSGIQTTVGLKYYNPSNISLVTRNINCSIYRVDNEKKTQLGIKSMESCIINPHEEVCIKTQIIIPYLTYLKAGNWKLIPDWIVLTIEGDFAIAGTRQVFPLSLNAYVNPNLFENKEFNE